MATCIDGEVEVVMNCLPLFDYARAIGSWSYSGDGYGQRASSRPRARWRCVSPAFQLGLAGARRTATRGLGEGASAFAALSWGGSDGPAGGGLRADLDDGRVLARLAQERKLPDHPWRSYLERSALVLKGSATRRPARYWPRRRRRCRRPGWSATGITASAGCATRRSCCAVSRRSVSSGRRSSSSRSCSRP